MADRQNRVGSKIGGAGVAGASESNVDRRERLRKLALETIGTFLWLPDYHLGVIHGHKIMTSYFTRRPKEKKKSK